MFHQLFLCLLLLEFAFGALERDSNGRIKDGQSMKIEVTTDVKEILINRKYKKINFTNWKFIGDGGTANAYRAFDETSMREVAIKVFRSYPRGIREHKQYSDKAKNDGVNYIAEFYGQGKEQQYIEKGITVYENYLIMEAGEMSLKEYMKGYRNRDNIHRLYHALLHIIKWFHDQGEAHGDVALRNFIMVTKDGKKFVKAIDFEDSGWIRGDASSQEYPKTTKGIYDIKQLGALLTEIYNMDVLEKRDDPSHVPLTDRNDHLYTITTDMQYGLKDEKTGKRTETYPTINDLLNNPKYKVENESEIRDEKGSLNIIDIESKKA